MILRKLKNSVFLGHFLNDILIIHSDWSVKKKQSCAGVCSYHMSLGGPFCLLYCSSVTMVCAISHGDHHSLIYTIIFFFKFENRNQTQHMGFACLSLNVSRAFSLVCKYHEAKSYRN